MNRLAKLSNKFFNFIKKPHNFYIICALITGTLMATIAIPPYRGPDEASHTYRIYEITDGDILLNQGETGLGYNIPDSIHRVNIAGFSEKNNDITKVIDKYYQSGEIQKGDTSPFQSFEGAGLYPPISYINYLPGSIFSKLFNINKYIFLIILRLSGFIICAFLIYLAIRLCPISKWLLVAIGLMPMTLHQMSVVTTDGLLISSIMLFTATTLYLRNLVRSKRKVTKKHHIILLSILTITAIVLSSKPGYWPILLLLLIIPTNPLTIFKRKNIIYPAIAGLALFVFGCWFLILSVNHQSNTKHFFETTNKSTLVSKKQIVKEIINPIKLSKRFIHTFIVSTPIKNATKTVNLNNFQPNFIFNTFIGSFGSLNYYAPSWMSLTVIGSLVIGLILNPTKLFLKRERWLAVFIIGASFVLISLIFWLSWTADNMPYIFGIQGRYFIPILPTLILLTPKRKLLQIKDNKLKVTLLSLIIINIITTLFVIFKNFYQ